MAQELRLKGFFLGSWARGAGYNDVGRMVGPEGAGVLLGAVELEVVFVREELGFSMEMGFGEFIVGSHTDLEGSVLDRFLL